MHIDFKKSGKSFIEIKNNKGPKTEPCGTPARILVHFDVARWEEHVTDGLSNNFKLGLEVCFLHHTNWVCKLNHNARPCQRL